MAGPVCSRKLEAPLTPSNLQEGLATLDPSPTPQVEAEASISAIDTLAPRTDGATIDVVSSGGGGDGASHPERGQSDCATCLGFVPIAVPVAPIPLVGMERKMASEQRLSEISQPPSALSGWSKRSGEGDAVAGLTVHPLEADGGVRSSSHDC
jgi:hypothetical protein